MSAIIERVTPPEPQSSDAKYQVLVRGIIADIRRGAYRPGSRLPSVRDLIAAGHGEATVRRAMRALQEQGWIQSGVGGAGTFVADPIPDVVPSLEDRVAEVERRLDRLESERRSD